MWGRERGTPARVFKLRQLPLSSRFYPLRSSPTLVHTYVWNMLRRQLEVSPGSQFTARVLARRTLSDLELIVLRCRASTSQLHPPSVDNTDGQASTAPGSSAPPMKGTTPDTRGNSSLLVNGDAGRQLDPESTWETIVNAVRPRGTSSLVMDSASHAHLS
jgi:hypothetical protein